MKNHVKKHRKKYTKFVLFFLLLMVFSIIEDMMAFAVTGAESLSVIFEPKNFTLIVLVALAFTFISELVDELFPHQDKVLLDAINKERNYIKKKR